MTTKAIDISNYQGSVKTATFQNHRDEIPSVILKSSGTWGKDKFEMYEDAAFARNIVAAYKAGMKIGIYHFSQAKSEAEAKKEAEYCLHIIARYRDYITLPVFIDWEFYKRLNSSVASKLGKQRCGAICETFCRTVKMAGYKTGVYANLSTLNAFLPSDLYKRTLIWCAQYANRCDYKHDLYMWQYSSSGRVSGIPGRIDMDYLYGTDPKPVPKDTYHGTLPKLPHRGWFSSGDKGEQVKLLQKFLNWYGHYGLDVDGEVGRKTIDAVRRYQGREKLKVDGAFGSECLKHARTVRR